MQIGARLRQARADKHLSLRAVGVVTGFSASFLSQVELGQTMPSLGSLQKIAEALGVQLADLVSTPATQSPVLRRSRREAVRSEWSRASAESLVPAGSDDQLSALLLRLDVDGRSGTTRLEAGRRLFAYGSSGVATLLIDKTEQVKLESGDSIVLDGPRNVAWENHSRRAAAVLTVIVRLGERR